MDKQDVGFFDVGGACPDLVIENGDLKADNGLETAALISLFSNKRVRLEQLPPGQEDQQGWWADLISEPQGDQIGSTFWRLESIGKINDRTPVEFENLLIDAFQWMLDDGVAAEVTASAERIGTDRLEGTVEIKKLEGENIPFKFVWDGQRLKLFEE